MGLVEGASEQLGWVVESGSECVSVAALPVARGHHGSSEGCDAMRMVVKGVVGTVQQAKT